MSDQGISERSRLADLAISVAGWIISLLSIWLMRRFHTRLEILVMAFAINSACVLAGLHVFRKLIDGDLFPVAAIPICFFAAGVLYLMASAI